LKPQVELSPRSPTKGNSATSDRHSQRYISLKEAEVRDFREILSQYKTISEKITARSKGSLTEITDARRLRNVKVREEALRIETRDMKKGTFRKSVA